ncbi:thioredoxin family protein [Hymenobacter sp. ASUV-10]|uniref:Thioredoxin family protein n=1 Tax=Hymenobacter aranciens TaxID=3063996 RepID=A0ABT9BFY4_9BACT|nr:thioredoxin family protein [Hymenobacter sp. ASUV-10]MDO7876700.1 thioredoxin family protein [Hymenobacter sp. ASUV-10]
MTAEPVLTPARLAAAYSYATYRQLIDNLLAEGRTTGPNQSESLTHYTQLNVQRMERLDKTTKLLPELATAAAQVPGHYEWLVITEGWCGDAAQIVPVLEAVARASGGRIRTHYLLRDENPDLMDRYLTRGGRAIPKLVVLAADTLIEVAEWGPRPVIAQTLYWELKNQHLPYEDLATALHTWYAKDKTRSTQQELLALLRRLHSPAAA